MGLFVLQSGYFEQTKNLPNRPLLITVGAPHCGQFSPVVSSFMGSIVPSSLRLKFIVFLHSGYPEQARKYPSFPHLITMLFPHFSHFKSVGVSSPFTLRISILAFSRCWSKGRYKST